MGRAIAKEFLSCSVKSVLDKRRVLYSAIEDWRLYQQLSGIEVDDQIDVLTLCLIG